MLETNKRDAQNGKAFMTMTMTSMQR